MVSTAVLSHYDNQIVKKTRQSIKKFFPMGGMMSKGNANPITLHSVNEDVFPRLWSFMAEVMVVNVELPRSTKEAVGELISSRNQCPMCVSVGARFSAYCCMICSSFL